MDQLEYTTTESPRKRGKHLTLEDRCTIKFMWKQGCSYRDIAKEIHCSPATICYELRRGTRTKTTSKGRPTTYSPRRGQAVYMEHRKNCGRKKVTKQTVKEMQLFFSYKYSPVRYCRVPFYFANLSILFANLNSLTHRFFPS